MSSREKIEARDTRELERRKRQLNAKPIKFALFFAAISIILAAGIDSISSGIDNQVQSSVVTEFFVKPLGLPYNQAISIYSTVNIISYIMMPILPFYKALADKFGRKPFLVFNIIGMGVGLGLSCWSPNPIIYFIGYGIVSFFVMSDMQVVYLYEIAPKKNRATFYGLIKGTGALSVALLPLIRAAVMGNDSTKWRGVYLIPTILAFLIAGFIFLSVRETPPFLKQRVEYLELPYEQRHPSKPKKGEKSSSRGEKQQKSGVFVALKHLMKSKQLFWLMIVCLVFSICSMTISAYVESIMTNFGMEAKDVTTALFIPPFFNTGLTWIAGFVSDRIGRKKVVSIAGILAIIGFISFNMSAFAGASPYIVGACYGICIGCWWVTIDHSHMMIAESAPTYNRTSVMGAVSLILLIGQIISLIMPIGAALLFDKIGFGYMLTAAPFVIIGVILMIWKVKETKGVDLSEVEYEEERKKKQGK